MNVTGAQLRVAERLKVGGAQTASEIAASLDLTPTAVRQHLAELEERGLVERAPETASRRGRPSARWSLTDLAMGLFPDRHGDLTVDLIAAIRTAVGEAGLRKVIDARAKEQAKTYKSRVGANVSIRKRVEALAEQRTAEGYMAEAVSDPDGSVLLVEHHCPICVAAETCQGLCRAELDVFRISLGRDVTVEREQHLLSGDVRCAYRIRRKGRVT